MKFSRTIGVAAVTSITIAGFAVSEASADSSKGSEALTEVGEFVDAHGAAALKRANPDLSTAEINDLASDSTAHVGAHGKIFFVEKQASLSGIAPSGITPDVTGIPLSDFLSLNSRPGSSRTIFLDFDGHTVPAGTIWDDATWGYNGSPLVAGVYPAFTMDGSTLFSTTEKQAIINAWAAVAEDYSMFDVNITTQDPGSAAIERTGNSDLEFGTRALITAGNVEFNPDSCGCGGIAYTGIFDESIESEIGSYYGIGHDEWQPAFAFFTHDGVNSDADYFPTAAAAGKFVSDVVSHEVGHNLSLLHHGSFQDSNHDLEFVDADENGVDDITGDLWTEYFYGQADGKNWAPIMGAGYVNGVVQWSNGDYGTTDEPSTPRNPAQDDISDIASTGLNLLPDETFNSKATAPVLTTTVRDGVIGSRVDVEWYKVLVTDGKLGVYSYAPTPNTNLDTKLTLLDWSGLPILSTDAPSTATDNTMSVLGMDGVLNATLTNGTYYIKIEGVGRTGSYSDYGSVGQYSIKRRSVTVLAIPTAPNPWITGAARKGQTLTANRGTWTAGTSLSQQWLRDGTPIAGATNKKYVLTTADIGHRIAVRVLGQLNGKRPVLRQSSRTPAVTR
ncbi:MAG: hypothetical protein ACKOWN_05060 [Microbacteriaceae bacterium]